MKGQINPPLSKLSIRDIGKAHEFGSPVEAQAVDAELERRHAASIRKERRNLASWKIKEGK